MIKLTSCFLVRGIVFLSKVLALRNLDPLLGVVTLWVWSGDGETALLRRGEVWGEVLLFLLVVERNSSLELTDFLCVKRFDSANILCLSLCVVGGELGGVVDERFWVEPGGEELGVITDDSVIGEVERARGDTGVCFLLEVALEPRLVGVVFLHLTGSFIDSALLGEVDSLGELDPLGVVNDWEVESIPPRLGLRRLNNDSLFLSLEYTLLDCFLINLPILLPSHGILFLLSCLMLVWSSGIVCTVIDELSLFMRLSLERDAWSLDEWVWSLFGLNIKLTTCTCCKPVIAYEY